MRNSVIATLALGSNLGDREQTLADARRALARRGILYDLRRSPVVESEPWGPPQPHYLNQVVSGRTDKSPEVLLAAIKTVERDLGRRSRARWGPREIDIDILDYGGRLIRLPGLVIPHPEIARRPFVLFPWSRLAPHHHVPGLERTVAELWAHLASAGVAGPLIKECDDRQ